MNFNNDIVKYSIPHQCGQCIHYESCNHTCRDTPNPQCRNFTPNNVSRFLNDVICHFSLTVPKSKEAKLKRVCSYYGTCGDKVPTLDYYYVGFINDCISELRKGKTVYIFKLSQLREIMRFYSDISATYVGDGIIELTGNLSSKTKC